MASSECAADATMVISLIFAICPGRYELSPLPKRMGGQQTTASFPGYAMKFSTLVMVTRKEER